MSSLTSQTPPSPRPSRPASIAPSISSVLSDATTIKAPIHEQRGFKSREAYLAALNEFAESKLYMSAGNHTLHGWYGEKTMDDYKKRPGLREGKKKRANRAGGSNDVNKDRRTTMAVIPEATNGSAGSVTTGDAEDSKNNAPIVDGTEKGGRLRRLSRVFSGASGNQNETGRRATIS